MPTPFAEWFRETYGYDPTEKERYDEAAWNAAVEWAAKVAQDSNVALPATPFGLRATIVAAIRAGRTTGEG